MSVRCPQTNLQIRIIKKKSLRGRKDFQCRYVYQYLSQLSDFYEEKDTNIRIVTPSGEDSDAI